MSSNYNKTKVSALFESKYGFSTKVTENVLEALKGLQVGDYLNITRVKEDTRERIAAEKGVDLDRTVAAYLDFASKGGETAAPAPEAPKAAAGAKPKLQRF